MFVTQVVELSETANSQAREVIRYGDGVIVITTCGAILGCSSISCAVVLLENSCFRCPITDYLRKIVIGCADRLVSLNHNSELYMCSYLGMPASQDYDYGVLDGRVTIVPKTNSNYYVSIMHCDDAAKQVILHKWWCIREMNSLLRDIHVIVCDMMLTLHRQTLQYHTRIKPVMVERMVNY